MALRIELLDVVPLVWVNREQPLPVCMAGENACPPDDVGGPHGYGLFLESLGDPTHEQHEDMVRWIGGVFDPV